MILLDHELLLLPVEEFKEYVVDPDAKLDFSRSDIDPSLHTTQERNWTSPDLTSILAFTLLRKGHMRIRSRPNSPSMLRTTKSARVK